MKDLEIIDWKWTNKECRDKYKYEFDVMNRKMINECAVHSGSTYNYTSVDEELDGYDVRTDIYLLLHKPTNVLVGYISTSDRIYIPGRVNVDEVFIDTPFRNKKIGTWFLKEIISKLKLSGFTSVSLNCYVSNKNASKLYKKLSFKPLSQYLKLDI